MPEIVDPGTVRLSNADVLDFLKRKHLLNAQDVASDKAAGRPPVELADNYQRALRKHERELSSRKYPYADNPGAYNSSNRFKSMALFAEKLDERILGPLEAKHAQDPDVPRAEMWRRLQREQDVKGLTEIEHFQIFNLAPQCVETLQNIVVDWEARFTVEEIEVLLSTVNEVYRCGAKLPGDVNGMDIDAIGTNGDATEGGEDSA
ncbi:hypothetical protein B0A48_04568 [Cryoendolithus antarcticus]|uniref:DNA-directed RNA polymerase III subunit RPC9 n=1 Tax=Cryoendolithus antarcticus TaxID=1507870 RepID=A0A1V8TG41_9PEZI|nr:hypothetical protein B0A48_04568 [Cryoendolithus antarcticus]